jgi:hypothetical protein
MTAVPIIDPEQFLHEQLAQASPDLMRELLATIDSSRLVLPGRAASTSWR